MAKNPMSIDEAKEIVASVLAQHGDEIELRDLLKALPAEVRPRVTRLFSELRKRGAVKTLLEVNPADGQVSHRVSVNKTLTARYNKGGA
jgi:hypothetical protein